MSYQDYADHHLTPRREPLAENTVQGAEDLDRSTAADARRFAKLAELFTDHAIGLNLGHLHTLDDVRAAMDYLIAQGEKAC